MKKTTDSFIERLTAIIESCDISDLEFYDKKAILQENKTKSEIKAERLQKLKEQGITYPLHKHNQVTYEKK